MIVRSATAEDASPLAEIYNYYIQTSHATFELDEVKPGDMATRIIESVQSGFPFLVADDLGSIAGYSYGRAFRPRPGYRHAVEVAVYIRPDRQRQGIAVELYRQLFPKLISDGAHSLIATIALPNDASIILHEKFGFEKVAHLCEVGRKFDRWIDVGYWQLLVNNDPS
jgi:L-amino acid N-acyltransferase YncA